jgi:hypothetical protein
VDKSVIFLSHETAEAGIAKVLKNALEKAFLGTVEVFVSSDPRSLPAGTKWLDTVTARLRQAKAMLVLASPRSVQRPWVNFEAGAAWIRDIPVIPLCHSGMTPSTLPQPLQALQGKQLLSSVDLDDALAALAGALECDTPEVDTSVLAQKLAEEVERVPPGSVAAPAAMTVEGSVLRLRRLSADREALEARTHGAILRMQTLRAEGGRPQDPVKLANLLAEVERFVVEPESFAPDEQVDALLVRIEAMSAELQPAQDVDVHRAILLELREMNRRQARTAEILMLDLDRTAEALGVPRDAVQDALSDLLVEGKVEGYAETFGQSAIDGSCRITEYGMATLASTA